MKIQLFEPNLFWSARLVKNLKGLGHEVVPAGGEVAIVNLGALNLDIPGLIAELKSKGVFVIGHAGHKEKELRNLGKEAGCDRIASNSEMTFKLESLLAESH